MPRIPNPRGQTRRFPQKPFSTGIAIVRSPHHDGDGLDVALLYDDPVALQTDFSMVSRWRRVRGLTALSRELAFEKTPHGQAYLELTWRSEVPSMSGRRATASINDDGIAVRIAAGGQNRGTLIRSVARSTDLFVLFHLLPDSTTTALRRAIVDFGQRQLPAACNTVPLQLSRVRIFGRTFHVGTGLR